MRHHAGIQLGLLFCGLLVLLSGVTIGSQPVSEVLSVSWEMVAEWLDVGFNFVLACSAAFLVTGTAFYFWVTGDAR
jgi:hypothetical protein